MEKYDAEMDAIFGRLTETEVRTLNELLDKIRSVND